jgi:DNA polymerase-3 subunit gamma/tau
MCENRTPSQMSHIALYRKYRPRTFEEVTGQEHITRALSHAIDRATFVHAYLFSGPRGCGKTSTARLVAQSLNCEGGPTSTPCGSCRFCKSIPAGSCVDVVEMDAASETGIDDIRASVIERAQYPPLEARFKVYIIDEVHDLSRKAFDALLKTVEEPPPYLVFILATTEPAKVPGTIRSRCQQHAFRRGSVRHLIEGLERVAAGEGIDAEPAALAAIARLADGGYRDAISLLEQAASGARGKLTLDEVSAALGLVTEEAATRLLQAIADGDAEGVLSGLDDLILAGREPRGILEALIHRCEELVRAAHGSPMPGVEKDREALLHEQAVRVGRENLMRVWPALAEAHSKLRTAGLPRLWLEIALLGLASGPAATKPNSAAAASAPATSAREPQAAPPAKKAPPKAKGEVGGLNDVWAAMLGAIQERSKGAAKTLAGTGIVAVNGKHAVVAVPSQMMFDKLSDPGTRASKELLRAFREATGDSGWTLEYSLAEAQDEEAGTPENVPMPLEGEDLERAVQEDLGGEKIS